MPRVFSLYSMASVDAEEWGSARVGSPGGLEGGNPGEPSSKSSEGLDARQEDP